MGTRSRIKRGSLDFKNHIGNFKNFLSPVHDFNDPLFDFENYGEVGQLKITETVRFGLSMLN